MIFPWSNSSMRDNVEPATSGTAAPASGAGGAARAAAGGCAASPAAVLAPGEAPTPVLPGAAPSCGPVEGSAPGEDVETPSGPSTDGSMMFWRRTADRSNNEFTASSLLSSNRCPFGAPAHSKAAGGETPAGQRAARRVPRGRPRRCRRALVLRGERPARGGLEAAPLHPEGWRPARRLPWQGPRRRKRSSSARYRMRAAPAPLAATLSPT